LHVALEFVGDQAREGLRFDALTHRVAQRDRLGLVILAAIGVLDHFRALSALDEYLDGAVRELEQLQHARKRADLVDGLRRRLVVGPVLLGGEQDEGVGPNHLLERADRLLASDEEGRDHVRKYDGVAQWQYRIGSDFTWRKEWGWLCTGHGSKPFLLSLCATTSPSATTECRWPGRRNTGRRSDIRTQRGSMIPRLTNVTHPRSCPEDEVAYHVFEGGAGSVERLIDAVHCGVGLRPLDRCRE